MATLTEVAAVAGVSKSTVHRVVRRRGDVTGSTAHRVMEAVEKLGYTPPAVSKINGALHDSTRGNRNLGVIFYDTRSSANLTVNLLHSLDKKFSSLNRSMLLAQFDGTGAIPDFVQDHIVDGLVIRPGNNFEQIERKLPGDIPVVWLFEDQRAFLDKNYDSVLPNEVQVANLACSYLRECGSTKIAAINMFPEHRATRTRVKHISNFAAEDFQACYTVNDDRPEEVIIEELFKKDPEISGLFVAGDSPEVMKAYLTLLKIGKKPCENVHLVTCTEDERAINKIDPRIGKIDICIDSLVDTAIDTLIWRIDHPDRARRIIYIDPKLC